jgi:Telomere resolvase
MDASLLLQAAAQAKTGWLEQALADLLPQVWNLTVDTPGWQETAASWAAQFDRLFVEKKLSTPGQQKNRRTDIANALRTFDPKHPLIPFVLLSSEVYTAMNQQQAIRLNARENKFFSTQQADELVERAIRLLDSQVPDEAAAGLAVLVGRRISEILLSQFNPKTAFSVRFSEAVKRRGGGLAVEIPTLAPADRVLRAIAQLKQVWTIADLMALKLPDNRLKRRINARYSGVPHACRQHFADLVPGREAETDAGERLYTHLFRAVYAEIATYYYKPLWVPDHRFKAEIQGHFKLTEDGQKIPNYSARQNYDDYLIRDRVSGEPGVRLGEPGVEILEVFQSGGTVELVEERRVTSRRLEPGTINALIYRSVDRLLCSKHWAQVAAGLVLVTGRAIQALLEKTLEEKSGFSILVDGLEVPSLTGAAQVIAAWKRWKQLEPLPGGQMEAAFREVCLLTFEDLLTLQSPQDLRAVYSAIAIHWFCPPDLEDMPFLMAIGASDPAGFETVNADRGVKLPHHTVQGAAAGIAEVAEQAEQAERYLRHDDRGGAIDPQPAHRPKPRLRRKVLSVDADLLRTVAAAFGLVIRGKGGAGGLSYEAALGQLLTLLDRGQSISPGQPAGQPEEPGAIQAIQDQARTLAWLTGRLETLEHQVTLLQQERDEAIAQVSQAGENPELGRLRLENESIRQERDLANRKLLAFRQLLIGNAMQEGQTEGGIERVEQPNPAFVVQPSVTPQPEPPKLARKRLSEDEALAHVRKAILAIMHFNDQQGRTFEDKWYISFPVLQSLLRANGFSANQKILAVMFEEMREQLEIHHDRHHLGSRHNRRHPDIKKIIQTVCLN